MSEIANDGDWEIVPIDTPHPPARNQIRAAPPSRALFELRISISSRTHHYHHHNPSVPTNEDYNNGRLGSRGRIPHGTPMAQDQSLLFQIPPEIRFYIYELVFTLSPDAKMVLNPKRRSVLTFLQTCRLVRDEAESIFYSINRLRLDKALVPSTLSLSNRRRAAIKAMAIISNKALTVWSHITNLCQAPNLKSLHIISPTDNLRYVDIGEWKLMRHQMVTCLQQTKQLEEVKVFWKASAPDQAEPGELQRMVEFQQVIEQLESCVSSR